MNGVLLLLLSVGASTLAFAQPGFGPADPVWQCSYNSDHDVRIAACTVVIEQKPAGAQPLYDPMIMANFITTRGSAYLRKGEFELALSDFNRAIEINPRLSRAYLDRSEAYMSRARAKGEDQSPALADIEKQSRSPPTMRTLTADAVYITFT